MPGPDGATELDRRFMAAAIRLSERHVGLTGTNPSVGALIVRDDGQGPRVVGRGVTARDGRPHAEAIALCEAGGLAAGATAYVTLEPCSHHGHTPPCAEALVRAGIARVVSAAGDPDGRVDGRGHAILRSAGLAVVTGVMPEAARRPLSGYLARATRNRPEVTLKMAVSGDGRIGQAGRGGVRITGAPADAQTHLLRARHDAILVGIGTVLEDDPLLTCRLPGLADRSPLRIVLDARLRTPLGSQLVRTARDRPTALAFIEDLATGRTAPFRDAGCRLIACAAESEGERIALAGLLAGLADRGVSSLLVEGGSKTAQSFLDQDLVDRIILIEGSVVIGPTGLRAPLDGDRVPDGFRQFRDLHLGCDRWREFERLS